MTTTSKRRASSSPFSARHLGILEKKTQERATWILDVLKSLLVDDVIGLVQQYAKQRQLVFIDASQCDCEGEPWRYGCDGQSRDAMAFDPAAQTWTALEPIPCHYCTLVVCNGTVHAFQPHTAEHREWNVVTGTFQHDDDHFPLKNQSFRTTEVTTATVADKYIFLLVKKHGFPIGALELHVAERKWSGEGDVVASRKTPTPMTAWSKSVADFLRCDDKKPLILTSNNDRIYAWHSKWMYAEVNCFHLDIDKGPFIWHMQRQRVQPAMAASRELNAIFACGGQYYNTAILANSCEWFDLTDRKWRFIAPMKHARQGGIAVCVESRIVVCGGKNNANKLQLEVEMYNPISDTWSVLPPCPREWFTPDLVLTV